MHNRLILLDPLAGHYTFIPWLHHVFQSWVVEYCLVKELYLIALCICIKEPMIILYGMHINISFKTLLLWAWMEPIMNDCLMIESELVIPETYVFLCTYITGKIRLNRKSEYFYLKRISQEWKRNNIYFHKWPK